MSIIEFWRNNFHTATASLTGATASAALPIGDILTKICIGIAVGVGTWITTHTIAWVLNRFRKVKCKLD